MKTDQFIIASQNSLGAKQNETQLEDLAGWHEEVDQSPLALEKALAVIENHRGYRGRKL